MPRCAVGAMRLPAAGAPGASRSRTPATRNYVTRTPAIRNYVTGTLVTCTLLLILKPTLVKGETLATIGAFLPPFLLHNFEDIVKTASETCEVLPLEILYSRQYTLELPLIDIIEFTREGKRPLRLSRAHKSVDLQPSEQFVLYVPGWWNTPTDESSEALVEGLLQKHQKVFVVDTRLCFCRGYISSASRVNALAHVLFELIKNLNKKGVPLSSIHMIGFSLGAHVAGMTGKLVQSKLSGKVGRITALDPAKPCFKRSVDYRLGRKDAKFVQVVHSSAGILGLEQPMGHVDVYINGVSVKQPECLDREITIECDHAQAWKVYSASIVDENVLVGKKCANWEKLMGGECDGNSTVLGYSCSEETRGLYLYKSEARKKRKQPKPSVNIFDVRTWLSGQ